jgi:hypothetical protein
MAGRTKAATFTGKRKKVFMIAVIAFDPGETLVKVTAVKVLIYHVQNMRPPIPVLLLVTAVPCAFKLLKMRFNTPVVLALARAARSI